MMNERRVENLYFIKTKIYLSNGIHFVGRRLVFLSIQKFARFKLVAPLLVVSS